jgi:hypothetical protein
MSALEHAVVISKKNTQHDEQLNDFRIMCTAVCQRFVELSDTHEASTTKFPLPLSAVDLKATVSLSEDEKTKIRSFAKMMEGFPEFHLENLIRSI